VGRATPRPRSKAQGFAHPVRVSVIDTAGPPATQTGSSGGTVCERAAIGAVVGGVAGGAIGNYLDKRA